MGWFNGLTKEEDKIIDRLVGLMELSYAAGISKVTTQRTNFFKALNDALEELKILPEGMIVEYGRFWYELNPNIRKTYIQDCGKHRYKGVFTQYFKNKKI